jgi:hypothetical protein
MAEARKEDVPEASEGCVAKELEEEEDVVEVEEEPAEDVGAEWGKRTMPPYSSMSGW